MAVPSMNRLNQHWERPTPFPVASANELANPNRVLVPAAGLVPLCCLCSGFSTRPKPYILCFSYIFIYSFGVCRVDPSMYDFYRDNFDRVRIFPIILRQDCFNDVLIPYLPRQFLFYIIWLAIMSRMCCYIVSLLLIRGQIILYRARFVHHSERCCRPGVLTGLGICPMHSGCSVSSSTGSCGVSVWGVGVRLGTCLAGGWGAVFWVMRLWSWQNALARGCPA